MTSDLELLGRFAREKSQDAFTELVQRHVNLVFSAAFRQVRSPQLAEEVAQSVFTDLARVAATPASPLVGSDVPSLNSLTPWLYTVTRRTAIDVIRRESRRQLREQIAVEMTNMNATANDWTHIEPLLDDAMAALDGTDRSAVLLRYFENLSLREVGEALGTSEDAAQKRVSRAVELLREFFSKRNVTVGTGGLVVLISANAVQSAPVGLAVAISTSVLAGTVVSTATTIAITKTIAMTTLQKTVITAAFVAAAGAGIFEAHQAAQFREQNQILQQQQASLAEQIHQLQREREETTNRLDALLSESGRLNANSNMMELLRLRGEVASLQNTINDPTMAAAKAWHERVDKLKQWLEAKPDANIPEFHLLNDEDWLAAVKDRKLNSDNDYRWAASTLREAAENKFGNLVESALQKYSQVNEKRFPTDLAELQSYFDSPVDEAILQRWEIVSGKTVPGLGGFGDWVVTQKNAVDDIFDSRIAVGLTGYGSTDFLSSETRNVMGSLYKAFSAANNGATFTDYSQLLPYASTPEQRAAIKKWMERKAAKNY